MSNRKKIFILSAAIFLLISCGRDSRSDSGTDRDESLLPTCQSLCPQDHRSLRGELGPLEFLSFENFGYRGIGRCRGHVLVSQKLVQLGEFQPRGLDCSESVLSDECRTMAQDALELIMNFDVATIKGFENLLEFSSHPEIKAMLKREVRKVSHRYRAVAGKVQDNSHPTREIAVFYEALRRTSLGLTPYIGIYGNEVGHHALMALRGMVLNDSRVLCVRDPNLPPKAGSGENCENYVELDGHRIVYHRAGLPVDYLEIFQIYSDEDQRAKKYIRARKEYCMERLEALARCRVSVPSKSGPFKQMGD